MAKEPISTTDTRIPRSRKLVQRVLALVVCTVVAQTVFLKYSHGIISSSTNNVVHLKAQRAELLSKCANIHVSAGPPPSFSTSSRTRNGSDRWVPGTPPTLLRNAKIWTGARSGTEIVYGDVLLDKGVIIAVGYIPPSLIASTKSRNGELRVHDVGGKWITPGLVDLHSHIGVYSSPSLSGRFSILTAMFMLIVCRCFRWELEEESNPSMASQHRWSKHARRVV